MASTIVPVDTPQGQARFFVDLADRPISILVLGHGAGGGVGAADLELLARTLPPLDITVARFEQPWRAAGRKVGASPPRLDEAWIAALGWLVEQEWAQQPLVAGGQVRVLEWHVVRPRHQCRSDPLSGVPAASPRAAGKSRLTELLTPIQPRLVAQGSKDSFGTAEELRAAIGKVAGITLVELPGVGHSYRIAKSSAVEAATLHATLVTEVSRFIATTVGITTS